MVDPRDGNSFITKVLYLQTVYEIVSESSLRRSSLRSLPFNNNWPAFYDTSFTP